MSLLAPSRSQHAFAVEVVVLVLLLHVAVVGASAAVLAAAALVVVGSLQVMRVVETQQARQRSAASLQDTLALGPQWSSQAESQTRWCYHSQSQVGQIS